MLDHSSTDRVPRILRLRLTDRIQHIAVALAVHRLLESLDGQAQVDLIGRNIFADGRQIGGLDAVQEDEEVTESCHRPSAPPPCSIRIILYIRAQVDLLRHPEIVHGLPVPVADPGIFHIVKII